MAFTRTIQANFSAGMFRSVRQDLIPETGSYDITNGLLSEDGSVYKRGGTFYRSNTAVVGTPSFLWSGFLTGGQRTVSANSLDFYRLDGDGTLVNIGGAGLPLPGRAEALNGKLYFPGGATYDGTTLATETKAAPHYATVANRVIAASGDHVYFTGINGVSYDPTDFHVIPGGVQIIGLAGLRDSLAVFTTGGVWVISGLALNLTDADGNVQQRLDQYSRNLILWGAAGISGYETALIVPARDAVWMLSIGVASEVATPFRRLSDPITGLYQSYVGKGYVPGNAVVYRNHYLLPILTAAGAWVDTLVCRLDAAGTPWTHLTGTGASVTGFAVRDNTGVPELLGATSSGRIVGCRYFDPEAQYSTDADGIAPRWEITTRDYPTGPLNVNHIQRLKASYELQSVGPAAEIDAWYLSGRPFSGSAEWGLFDWGEASWGVAPGSSSGFEDQLVGPAPADPYGDQPFTWPVNKRSRFGRFRLRSSDPSARLTLQWLEMDVRDSGRV